MENKHKLNKKVLFGAVAAIVVLLVVVLAIFAPKSAEASKITEQLNLGDKYLNELNYEQAAVAYQAVIDIDPKNEDAYLGLADIYLAKGDYDMAITILEDALKELSGAAAEEVEKKLDTVKLVKKATEVVPTVAPTATMAPQATATPVPTEIPVPTATSEPTAVPEPTATNAPTATPVPTEIPVPTEEPKATSTPKPTNTPTPAPTNTPVPTPTTAPVAQGTTRVELELGADCFAYDTVYDKYMCIGLSEKGYAEFKKYDYNYLVSLKLPGTSDKNREVYGFSSEAYRDDSYDLLEILTDDSAYLELVCADNYEIYYGVYGSYLYYENSYKLKSVVLNEGLETIGYGAFSGCDGIEEIEIPDSVYLIDSEAFRNCEGLKNVTIGKSVETIGINAFAECIHLKEITIPESVEKVDSHAFYNCTRLEKVTLSDNITTFGAGAFRGCKNLVIDVFEMGGRTFEDNVFENVRINKLVMSSNATGASHYGSAFMKADIGTLEIKEGVTDITDYLFGECAWLKNITLPSTLERIGWGAFNSTGLKEITIPNSVETVESHAFYNCANLEKAVMSDNVTSYNNGVFRDCKKLVIDTFEIGGKSFAEDVFTNVRINKLVMSSNAREASYYGSAFAKADIGTLEIKEGVTDITDYLFKECAWIKSIMLPSTLERIGWSAFESTGLKEITIPNSVETVESYAFYNCSNLEKAVLSDNVTSYNNGVFRDCKKLVIDTFEIGEKSFAEDVFTNVRINKLVMSSNAREASYYGSAFAKADIGTLEIKEGVTDITDYMFKECAWLKKITLPSTLERIGWSAFESTGLKEITIPDSVDTVESGAFFNCSDIVIYTQSGSAAAQYAEENGIQVQYQ